MQKFIVEPEATNLSENLVEGAFLSLDGRFRSGAELDDVVSGDLISKIFADGLEPTGLKHTVYNFEVEGTHTYIAGGYRVHNQSTLSFLDTEDFDRILDVREDQDGNIVVVTETDGGNGRRTTVASEVDNSGTVEITSEYEYTVRDANGNARFFIKQTEIVRENADGEREVVSVDVEDINLLGDAVGGGIADVVTPFILQSIGANTIVGQLTAGTLINTVLQNISETGLNLLHHTITDARQNADSFEFIIEDAWGDFGIDLAVNGVESAISITSQLILSEIFDATDLDSIPGRIMSQLLSEGIENVISTGVNNFLGDTFLGHAYEPENFQFTPGNIAGVVFQVLLDEAFPAPETTEGQIGSAIASLVSKAIGLGEGLTGAGVFAFAGPQVVAAVIAFVVGEILDLIFDKDPQAFATLEFNSITGEWGVSSTFVDDGGQLQFAVNLANSTANILNEFKSSIRSNDNNFDDVDAIRIGHYESSAQNGNGTNYAMSDTTVVYAAVVDAVAQFEVNDGDLKILRALDLTNLEQTLADMSEDEAFSYIYSRMRIARDYQYYLENTELVNLIITAAPDSAEAAAWLATILSAVDLGLSEAFVSTGTELDNLFLTSDGDDIIDGADGDDEIRTYDGNDILFGGAGDDLLSGGVGADAIDGGDGTDTLTFDDGRKGVSLDLHQGVGLTEDAEGDTYSGIENVIGSNYDDTIIGDGQSNEIDGNSGTDTLYGHGGDDIIQGNDGNDILYGDLSNDTTVSGNDHLYGDAGDDVLHGGEGVDTFDGGDGFDEVSYEHSTLGTIASLAAGYAKIHGDIETFSSIEGLIGSAHTDILTGNSGSNTIEGGFGDDMLYGGKGADTYRYSLGDGNDLVVDYDTNTSVVDRIVFSDINSDQVTLTARGDDLRILFENGDVLTVKDHLEQRSFGVVDHNRIEQLVFADGVVWEADAIRNNIVSAGSVATDKFGTSNSDSFIHTAGDGSYSIIDSDFHPDTDRLIFSDINSDEVKLSQSRNNLIIELNNGEQVTLVEQLWEVNNYTINTIDFADAVTWDKRKIRDQLVSDMKSGGLVKGTQDSETYSHSLGDGSYTITDYDFHRGNDQLTFIDVASTELNLSRFNEDVIVTLANGETITIIDQLNEDRRKSLENFEFADGVVWDQTDFRNALVSDMKSTGTVIGTQNNETYEHSLGDGSYTISDYDFHRGLDRLVFLNVASTEMELSRFNEDAIITLENGEKITIIDQLNEDRRKSLENFEFADGVVWDQTDFRNALVSDMKATGAVVGTQNNETYEHSLGDGSYTISDYDFQRGFDRLVFLDATESEVTVSRSGNNLIFTLSNGETVTVLRQFDQDARRSIEQVEFSDGSVLGAGSLAQTPFVGGAGDDTIVGSDGNDILFGGAGNDTINGGAGNDAHYGEAGDDVIIANTGGDSFDGGTGIDTLNFVYTSNDVALNLAAGTATFENGDIETIIGFENVVAGSGDNVITGTSGSNYMQGGNGHDNLIGGDGDDILDGNAGDDAHFGEGGDDLFIANGGADLFDGGSGSDTIDMTYTSSDVVFDLAAETATFEGGGVESIISIENVIAGAGDNIIVGNASNNSLRGGAGADILTGGAGGDVFSFSAGDGNDVITDFDVNNDSVVIDDVYIDPNEFADGVAALDQDSDVLITYGTGDTILLQGITLANWRAATYVPVVVSTDGTEGADTINTNYVDADGDTVTNGAELIYGLGGDDNINGANGTDTIYGGDGNDTISGGRGSKTIYGEAGNDYLSAIDGSLLDGGDGDDHLFSNLNKGGDHTFTGGAGADTFEFNYAGTKEADQIITDFEVGTDTLIVNGQTLSGIAIEDLHADFTSTTNSDGDVVIEYGSIHSVTLNGLSEAEFFVPGAAPVVISTDGTEGADTINTNYVDADGDTVTNDAELIYGLGGDDNINGANGNDTIYGGDGNDTISGGRGSKTIYGGAGNDYLTAIDGSLLDGGDGDDHLFSNLNKGGDHTFTGGAGADTFEFNYAGTKEADQIITDFEVGTDTLIVNDQTLSGIAIEDLHADFTSTTNADGDVVIEYGGIHSVTLAGLSEAEFFVPIASEIISTDGTEGADVINTSYVDGDGDTVTDGAELIYGFGGDDSINSARGNDIVYGGAGNDTIGGSRGSKTIYGESGNDYLSAIDGSVLDGGDGDDHLFSNLNKGGDHTFTGGAGADTFEFNYAGTKEADQIITDFEVGTDTLIVNDQTLSGIAIEDLHADFTSTTNADGDVVIEYGGIHSVTLTGLSEAEFFSV